MHVLLSIVEIWWWVVAVEECQWSDWYSWVGIFGVTDGRRRQSWQLAEQLHQHYNRHSGRCEHYFHQCWVVSQVAADFNQVGTWEFSCWTIGGTCQQASRDCSGVNCSQQQQLCDNYSWQAEFSHSAASCKTCQVQVSLVSFCLIIPLLVAICNTFA